MRILIAEDDSTPRKLLARVLSNRAKGWLAVAAWFWALASVIFGGPAARVAVLAGLANYALFFGPEHWNSWRLRFR